MAGKKILLVEGKDDEHVVYAIRDLHKIDKNCFTIQDKKGIDNLFQGLELNLIEGSDSIERIGIIVDADLSPQARWEKTVGILKKAGYQNVPKSPEALGTIINQESLPKFGAWIMPDNQTERSYLETFLTFLVPENDKNWEQAKKCVSSLKVKPFVKGEFNHTAKAEIHTYLAWQEEPGKPFGTAITAKYLNVNDSKCQNFVEWLRRLFVND